MACHHQQPFNGALLSYTQFFFFFLLAIVLHSGNGQPCPYFGGDSQCPEGFLCQFDRCVDDMGRVPPQDCAQVKCGRDAECHGAGKCIPFSGRPCGRNVLVAEGLARAIVSDCGPRGKCIGGRCSIDKCADVLCDEANEYCRDGMCLRLDSVFCFSPFDCGPPSMYECQQNKCQRRMDTIGPAFSRPASRCDPGETFNGVECVAQDAACTQLVCPSGHSCFNGQCVPASSGINCAHSGQCPELSLCRAGRCVQDICMANGGKCPPEHACSPMSVPEGECRAFQGLSCAHSAASEDCPPPYFCIGGICVKDDCHRKVCQIGERCDGGICIRVEGNGCRDARKDCGEHFSCVEGICRDQISVYKKEEEEKGEGAAGGNAAEQQQQQLISSDGQAAQGGGGLIQQ